MGKNPILLIFNVSYLFMSWFEIYAQEEHTKLLKELCIFKGLS